MLGVLAHSRITMALATSKLDEYAHRILHQLKISHHFAVVAAANREGTRLHKDAILDFALRELARPDLSTVAMVGDRAQDIRAALSCGVLPVGVTWGYGTAPELLEAGAIKLIAHPRELLDVLQAA